MYYVWVTFIATKDNFIMYDNLQQAIHHKRFTSIPRTYPHFKFTDISSLQPWEKNTLDILIEDEPARQVKTFYHPAKKNEQNKYHTTMRGFSFRTERHVQPIQKAKSVATTSRKSAISHYNINGNILGELTYSPKSLPYHLPLKTVKLMRQKQKTINLKPTDFPERILQGVQSLMEMKRKLILQKDKSNQGFIQFNSEIDEQSLRMGNICRRSKVIALGFQKLSLVKSKRDKSSRNKLGEQTY